jgi:hypothetical protein
MQHSLVVEAATGILARPPIVRRRQHTKKMQVSLGRLSDLSVCGCPVYSMLLMYVTPSVFWVLGCCII